MVSTFHAAERPPSARVAARGGHRGAARRGRDRAGRRAARLERSRRRTGREEEGGQPPGAVDGVERRPAARVEAAAGRHTRLDAAWRAEDLDGRRHAGAARHPPGDGIRREHRRGALDAATAVGHDARVWRLPRPQPGGARRAGPRLRPRLPGRGAAGRRDRQAPLAARPGRALVALRQRRGPLRRQPHRRGAAVLQGLPPPRREYGTPRGADAGAHRGGEGGRRGGAARPQPARLAWAVRRRLRRRLPPVGLPHAGRPDDRRRGDRVGRSTRARHDRSRAPGLPPHRRPRPARPLRRQDVRQRAATSGRARRHRRPVLRHHRSAGPDGSLLRLRRHHRRAALDDQPGADVRPRPTRRRPAHGEPRRPGDRRRGQREPRRPER